MSFKELLPICSSHKCVFFFFLSPFLHPPLHPPPSSQRRTDRPLPTSAVLPFLSTSPWPLLLFFSPTGLPRFLGFLPNLSPSGPFTGTGKLIRRGSDHVSSCYFGLHVLESCWGHCTPSQLHLASTRNEERVNGLGVKDPGS